MNNLSSLLSCPERWTQKAGYRNHAGEEVTRGEWCRCCLYTAIAQTDKGWIPYVVRAIRELGFAARAPMLYGELYVSGIIEFNDHPETTFDDVMAVIRKAESYVTQ